MVCRRIGAENTKMIRAEQWLLGGPGEKGHAFETCEIAGTALRHRISKAKPFVSSFD
jgi:hypothetical protein